MTARIALSACIALALGWTQRALAAACSGATNLCSICSPNVCAQPNSHWSYELAEWVDGNGAQNTDLQNQVYAAFGIWGTDPSAPNYSAVPCSSLTTTQQGVYNTPNQASLGDGVNEVGVNVTTSGAQYCYLNPGSCGQSSGGISGMAVGLATLEFSGSGDIAECDVYFNSVDFPFGHICNPGGNGSSSEMDVETVANQEVGHCFGLDHYLDDYQAVMYPTVNYGDQRCQLEPHDINNICQVYPVAGAFGGSCSGGSGCNSPNVCVTDPTNASNQYCSTSCTGTGQGSCPTGYYCTAVTSPSGNYCVAGSSNAGVPVGIACTGDTQCSAGGTAGGCITQTEATDAGTVNTGFYGGYCTAQCTAAPDGGVTNTGCPTGSLCYPLGPGQPAGAGDSFCINSCAGFFPGACSRTDNPYECEPLNQGTDAQGNPTFSNFVCLPGCQNDADCQAPSSGFVCNTATNQCVITCAADVSGNANLCVVSGSCPNGAAACGNGGAAVGAACIQDNDCPIGGACLTDADGFPGGYCTVPSCGVNPSLYCGANAQCYIFDKLTNFGECFANCNADTDCRTGYSCYLGNPLSDGGAGPGVCNPSQATPDAGTTAGGSTGGNTAGSSTGAGASSAGAGNSTGNAGSSTGAGNGSTGNGAGSGTAGAAAGSSTGTGQGASSTGGTGPKPKPTTTPAAGCGCNSVAAPETFAWLGLMLALGLRRRRA